MERICITIRSLAVGGAEKQSLLLAKALNDVHDVVYIAISDNPKHEKHLQFIQENSIKYISLQGNVISKAKQFKKILVTNKIEYLFSYLPGDSLFAGIIGRTANVKFIFAGLRNAQIDAHKTFFLRMLHNRIVNYSISNTYQGVNEMVRRNFIPEKFIVIHNGMEVRESFYKRPPKDKVNLLTVGRFVTQKDYYTALRSIAYLSENYSIDLTYRIVGYGDLEPEIRRWIKKFGLENRVEMITNSSNLRDLYKVSDIYFSASIFEGLSNTIMEAMEFSLPIVATDVGDSSYLVKENVNGYLVVPKDYQNMASRIYDLCTNYEKRISFGKNSFDIIKANHSLETLKEKYLQVIENIKIKGKK